MNRIDEAVSPVVGVMLMLALVVMIAAVLSAFGGGVTSPKDLVSATFVCSISNDGTAEGSGFGLSCVTVDGGIQTKDLKLVTSWKSSDGTTGGEAVTAGTAENYVYGGAGGIAPFGFGSGISTPGASGSYSPDQNFGNYTFLTGTRAVCIPCDKYDSYSYDPGLDPGESDAMTAVLGDEWYNLRPGDKVDVKLLYVPSGTLVYDMTITVE